MRAYIMKNINNSIKILTKWCENKHWKVSFDTCGYSVLDEEEKIISINARLNDENQYYCLLHEIGHLLFRKNKISFVKYHPISLKAEANSKNKSLKNSKY